MKRDRFYFSHDYNARTDEKIKALFRKFGQAGYGTFWSIIEDLYQSDNSMIADAENIAFDIRADADCVRWILFDSGLFEIENGRFYSKSITERLEERNQKSESASRSAAKRWNNSNAMRTNNERNANANKQQCDNDTNASILNANASTEECERNANASKINANAMRTHEEKVRTQCNDNANAVRTECERNAIKDSIVNDNIKKDNVNETFPKSEKLKPFSEIMNADNTKILFTDLEWQNKMMAYGCTARELSKYLTEFQSDRYANGDQNREVNDLKKYFLNWLKIKIEKQTEKAKKDGDKRKDRFNIPIPDYNAEATK